MSTILGVFACFGDVEVSLITDGIVVIDCLVLQYLTWMLRGVQRLVPHLTWMLRGVQRPVPHLTWLLRFVRIKLFDLDEIGGTIIGLGRLFCDR